MNEKIKNIERIISEIARKEELKIEEIFRYGDKKIEFAFIYSFFWISVSIVDDISYDFTVFDSTLDNIVYNNTQFNVALDDLCNVFLKDIDLIRNKKLYG